MLGRYQIIRGTRPAGDPLPEGRRVDTRKHTSHFLRPDEAAVKALIADPSDEALRRFARGYEALIARRFEDDSAPFDELARIAAQEDVYLGCNCPTRWNPDVMRCHTSLALAFMKRKYPKLPVVLPARGRPSRDE